MTKKEKRICIFGNLYGLFLYYLIFGVNDNEIIISPIIPEDMRKNFHHINFKTIPYYEYYNASSKFLKMYKKIKVLMIRFFRIIKLRIVIFIKTFNKDVKVYGHGHTEFSFPIYEFKDAIMIEDGIFNYMELEEPELYTSYAKIYHLFGDYIKNFWGKFGTHENIKKIYLSKPDFPKIIEDKVEVVDVKELWNLKTEQEKTKILEIFNIKELVDNMQDNSILLLTQCFSEDRLIPIDEEIEIYKHLIKNQENKNIIIKTHPRETKDYHKIFPELPVIDQPFPLEIFQCVDIKIEKVITISSTAALHFIDDCEIEIYDKKTSSKEVNDYIDTLSKQIQAHENSKD